ncbi:hypothetical protein KL86DES1_10308 [uncultured Desulfovibrio sp.]|uniref:Uncharacterized protein n=1 Tax=uncultured Desulfovibrio sp. TaxID=167968 RepID=A0A212KY98_9BACT|nr:hypothetical protein KL86DES1_10308 [uncultured Desulfovibrio sp.]VZH32180.1 conserved protein of unknown function [Desulfovibrio sp. 86]
MLTRHPLRRVAAQKTAVLSSRLTLRLRLCGGRLLTQPPEQFQSEIALTVYWVTILQSGQNGKKNLSNIRNQ